MSEIPLDLLLTAADEAGIEQEDVWPFNYNGRYYARNCFGIVGGLTEFAEFLLSMDRLDKEGMNYASDLANFVTSDSMGRSTIFYFPGIQPYEGEDDGEDS